MKIISLLLPAISAALLLSPALWAGDDIEVTTKPKTLEKAPPLPLHTIEGVGGIFATPLAYLVNPGPAGTDVGLPSASATYVKANRKNVENLSITETLFGRVELGYTASRFGIGTLKNDVLGATGVDLGRDDIYLHIVNARVLVLPEASFGLQLLPAITAGCSLKVNPNIDAIDRQLGGALTSIGYRHDTGADFTLTATKALPLFGRALLLTLGGRVSNEAQLGYFGFGNTYSVTFEGSLAYNVTKWLWLAFEFRQKPNPFASIPGLLRPEQNLWTLGAVFVPNPHTTITLGYGHLGDVMNTRENSVVALQLKYEL